jgi:hypothetical protein
MPEGIKYDSNKPRLAEMIIDFKEPLLQLCKVWEFGANKYEKSNWKLVENGRDRYTNAMLRHLVQEEDFLFDDESKLLHASHIAFNALARLYFIIQELKENKPHIEEVYSSHPGFKSIVTATENYTTSTGVI